MARTGVVAARAGAIRSLAKIGRFAAWLPCAALFAALPTAHAAGVNAGTQTELVRFADPRLPAVRVVRGAPRPGVFAATNPRAAAAPAPPVFRATPANTEIVSFGNGTATTVAVVRGSVAPSANPIGLAPATGHSETIHFSGRPGSLVEIVRGIVARDTRRDAARDSAIELFSLADAGELDRVAFAVDGAESGHGANLAMWRPESDGPQGPMQVSAAAALDVGGGDRFDMRQNRLLGRAYLAMLYRRYGRWPDAIAAYNWGPGNLDNWIAAGRPLERLPLETARYLNKVLRDAFMAGPS